jgi:GR25 family glycosyltransferase involved in LPS biosynthesis
MKLFVIHYKKLENRKRDIIQQLQQFNITNYEFIEHYDRDTLTKEDIQNFEEGYKLCQIAITLSHLYAYKEIADKYECALIIEDDAIFHQNFIEIFNNYMKQLPNDFDAFFIGHGCNLHIDKNELKPNCNVYKKQGTRCTDSYVVSKKCATNIINYVNNIQYKINSPVDFWLNTVFKDLDLNIYWAEPHIVVQGTIIGKYVSSHLYEGANIQN